MKKFFTLFCAAVMCASMANAKLIFQESFDGKNGEVGQLCAGATNTEEFFDGFSYEETRWWSYSGSSNYIQVAEGSLSFKGYQTGIGNKAYLWSSGADDVRSFSSSAVTSGKVFLAAIINVEELSTATTGDYFMCLGDHANNYFLGRLYAKSIKKDDAWIGFKLGIAKNNESANYLHYSEEVFAPNTDILVVVEYEFIEGEKNDVARLYINPTKETSAPTVVICPDTVTSGLVPQGANSKPDAGTNGIFGVFLRQGYDATAKTRSTPKMFIDEIKVATAWADLFVEGEGEEEEEKDEVDDIAALMASPVMKGVVIKSQPVVIDVAGSGKDFCVTIQDASGAVIINDFFETKLLKDVKVGDKLDKLAAMPVESEKFLNGLATAQVSAKSTPEVLSSGNSVAPFDVSLAEVTKFGPALVQLKEIEFVGEEEQFAVGTHAVKSGEANAALRVPAGCDIIGEDIPAKADVKGMVVKGGESVEVRISASADVTNRVAKGGDEQGVESIQKSDVRIQKVIRNGQLIIISEGKMFNAQGAEL